MIKFLGVSFLMATLMAMFALAGSGVIADVKADDRGQILEVWKSPSCGCCGKWVDHMRSAGFSVRVIERDDLAAIKSKLGVPAQLRSCHTAKIGGYVVEGHVPASDVTRLLAKRPQVAGLSVPGMPLGSPGMEVASGEREAFDTVSFDASGRSAVFERHLGGPAR